MAQWRKVIVSGSSAVLNQISASGNIVPTSDNGADLGSSTLEWKDLYVDGTAYLDSATITAGTITGITDLVVADGGTGASTLTDGGILLGSGTSAVTAMSVLADGEFVVGDGTTDPVAESGDTARISLGVGSTSTWQITGLNIGAASDTTLTRPSAGDLQIESNIIYRAGGTDVAVADGGTGQSNLTNLITLGTHTTGNYVAAVTVGTGLGGAVASEGGTSAMTLDAAQTVITSVTNAALYVGRDADNTISFATDDTIILEVAGENQLTLTDGYLTPSSNAIVDLGTDALEFKDLYIDGVAYLDSATITAGTITGITDLAVADGGTGASTLNNLITMGTHTTGNYVATVADSGGGGITVANSGAESAAVTLELDINGLTTDSIASGDFIAFSDEGEAGDPANKETIDDVATLFAGDGLQASSAVMAVDVSDFAGTGLEDDSSENLRLASQGTGISGGAGSTLSITPAQTAITSVYNTSLKVGSAASQEYVDFSTSNEVNTKVNDTERLSITATGVDITGVATVSSNLTVGGNLDVNGTLTTIDTANSYVADKFMIIASGSTSATDGGFIVQGGVTSGYALGYDSGTSRWVLDNNLAHNATNIVPDAYVGTVELGTTDGDSQSAPTYGSGVGSIYVDTDDNEIWIYA